MTDLKCETPAPTCGTCRFWEHDSRMDELIGADRGQCRFNPPTWQTTPPYAQWPCSHREDWCGKWEAKP